MGDALTSLLSSRSGRGHIDARGDVWREELASCLRVLGRREAEAALDAKGSDWKTATAVWLKGGDFAGTASLL